MNTDRPLFRPEAVEYHARGRGATDVELDLRATRLTWSFRILALLLVAGVLIVFDVHVEETTRGRTVLAGDGRSATVLAPVGALPRLRPGQEVHLGRYEGRVAGLGTLVNDDGVAHVPVRVTFDSALPDGGGEAVIVLGRRSLFDVIRRRDSG